MRYRFVVEYEGTPFHGWQSQPGGGTVQQHLEAALATALRAPVRVVGAGRTDAGVHAAAQVAHFDLGDSLPVEAIQKSVNALTPREICVREMESCSPDFHARYSALYRRYVYTLLFRPSALLGRLAWQVAAEASPHKFRGELEEALGRHDFSAFSIPRRDGRSTVCTLEEAGLRVDAPRWIVSLRADRFLHKMVRSLVGACFDVARGRHPPGLLRRLLLGGIEVERTWAPARGLCLAEVGYADYPRSASIWRPWE